MGINFARNNNIWLAVKNTGKRTSLLNIQIPTDLHYFFESHDFSWKSTGVGALSIWTHNLEDIIYIPGWVQDGGAYYGPAFKSGSGVKAFE